MKRFGILAVILLCMIGSFGCAGKKDYGKKLRDLEFTVVEKEEIPKELLQIIEKEQEQEFHLTYGTEDYLYICVGYGQMETGGYSISVDDCYLTEEVIYIDTNLHGPKKGEKTGESKSTPYIVVKIEYYDHTVVFH